MVSNGQKASQDIFNAAFMSRTVDTSTTGKVGLSNTADVNSGAEIVNLQRAVNEVFDAVGMSGEGDSGRKTYSSSNYIATGDDRKVAIGKLDAAIKAVANAVASGGTWTKQTLADNTSTYTAITGATFDSTLYKAGKMVYTIYRTDGSVVRREKGAIHAGFGATTWVYERESNFTDALNITDGLRVNSSTGAVEFKSDSMGGTYSGYITWQFTELIPTEF